MGPPVANIKKNRACGRQTSLRSRQGSRGGRKVGNVGAGL